MGLENNIPNSFLNAEVLLLWSLKELRTLVLAHTCAAPVCISCELKFLFRMFDQGLENGIQHGYKGTVVHATNFYRLLAHVPDSIAFGILDDPNGIPALSRCEASVISRRAERFLRFAMSHVMNELEQDILPKKTKSAQVRRSPLSQQLFNLFGVAITQSHRCPQGHVTTKKTASFVLDLAWPTTASPFVEVLERSLCGENKKSNWCEMCRRDEEGVSDRSVASLPQYIIVMIGQPSAATAHVRMNLLCDEDVDAGRTLLPSQLHDAAADRRRDVARDRAARGQRNEVLHPERSLARHRRRVR